MDMFFIITPVSGAVIGYFTNWLAIKMLFRPHEEKRLFGARIPFTPGIIPKERGRLAGAVGKVVETHLLTPEVVAEAVASGDAVNGLSGKIVAALERANGETLGGFVSHIFDGLLLDDAMDGVSRDVESVARIVGGNMRTKSARFASDRLLEYMKTTSAFPALIPLARRAFEALDGDERFNAWLTDAVRLFFDGNVNHIIGVFVDKDKIAGNIKKHIARLLSDSALLEKTAPTLYELALKCDADFEQKLHGFIELKMDGELTKDALFGVMIKDIFPVGDAVIGKGENTFRQLLTAALKLCAGFVSENVRVGGFVEARVNDISMAEGEKIILGVMGRELKIITALGGALGFIIGLAATALRAL
jgi:hypothetical protein